MNKLKSKLKSKKGFTLIEMLIVVAIVAILIALAFPAVNNALDKARLSADDGNFRNAKAVAVIMEMQDDTSNNGTYYFDADEGDFKTSGGKPYTAQATRDSDEGTSQLAHKKDAKIKVIFTNGKITTDVSWENPTG